MKQATFYRCGVVGLEANKAGVNVLGNSGLFSEIPIPRSGRGIHIVTRSRRSTERFGLEASARPTTCCHHRDFSPASRDRDFRKQVVFTPRFTYPFTMQPPEIPTSIPGYRPGKKALLVFFETDCPTCQLALPYFNALAGDSVQVIALSIRNRCRPLFCSTKRERSCDRSSDSTRLGLTIWLLHWVIHPSHRRMTARRRGSRDARRAIWSRRVRPPRKKTAPHRFCAA